MSQVLDIFEGYYFCRKSFVDNSSRNPLKLRGSRLTLYPENPKTSALKKQLNFSTLGFRFLNRVNSKLVERAQLLSLPDQAEACNGAELDALPSVQTLRGFPREELFRKVVMVRVDARLLLGEQQEQQFLSGISHSTIKYLHKAGARVILVSSWNEECNSKTLAAESVAEFLSSILGLKVMPVEFVTGLILSDMEAWEQSDILLLENLFHFKEESANCKKFAKHLSSGIDIFVNDAFSQSHKILASTVGIAGFCYASMAGFYFEEGLCQLKKISRTSEKPYFAIVGGGNLVDKAAALRFLASICDGLVFVGNMALQIMHALGLSVPVNLVEPCAVKEALSVVEFMKSRGIQVVLPKDFLCLNNLDPRELEIFSAECPLDGWQPVDLGPKSLEELTLLFSKCKAYPFELVWDVIYDDPTRSLVVDIGSGNGLFLFGMARMRKDLNFLGLEINEKLVNKSLDHLSQSGLKNGYFIRANATSTFRAIVSSYPGKLVLVSIQCPNPNFNKPEYRWRMLQRSLVEAIADLLASGGKVFLQSDIEAVAVQMKDEFIKYGKGKLKVTYESDDALFYQGEWLRENPFGVQSDWEQHVLDRGAPMYRLLLSK